MRQENLSEDFVKQALEMGLTFEDMAAGESEADGKKYMKQFQDIETGMKKASLAQNISDITDTQTESDRNDLNRERSRRAVESVPDNFLGRQAVGLASGIATKAGALVNRPFNSELSDKMIRFDQAFQQGVRQKDEEQLGSKGARVAGWVRGAGDSIATALGLAAGGPYTIAAGFAMMEGNDALTTATDKGLEGSERLAYAGRAGLIEAAFAMTFQKLGFGGFESTFGGTKPLEAGMKPIFKHVAKVLGQELPEETATELTHLANQKYSDIDPEALSSSSIINTMIDTIGMTTIASGTMGTIQGVGNQKDAKERRSTIASVLKRAYGFDEKTSDGIMDRASKSKENDDAALGREVEKEVLKTPFGSASWVADNPGKALELAREENPSRKMFAKYGLPEMSGEDRSAFAANARGLVNEATKEEQKPDDKDDDDDDDGDDGDGEQVLDDIGKAGKAFEKPYNAEEHGQIPVKVDIDEELSTAKAKHQDDIEAEKRQKLEVESFETTGPKAEYKVGDTYIKDGVSYNVASVMSIKTGGKAKHRYTIRKADIKPGTKAKPADLEDQLDTAMPKSELQGKTWKEIKALAKERKILVKGKKVDLIAAIEKSQKENPDNIQEPEPVKKPETLFQFVSKTGGLNSAEAQKQWGETITDITKNKKINNKNVGLPILQKNGRTIDEVARAAMESGFVKKDDLGNADIVDFFDKMRESFGGKDIFAIEDIGKIDQAEIDRQEKEHYEEMADDKETGGSVESGTSQDTGIEGTIKEDDNTGAKDKIPEGFRSEGPPVGLSAEERADRRSGEIDIYNDAIRAEFTPAEANDLVAEFGKWFDKKTENKEVKQRKRKPNAWKDFLKNNPLPLEGENFKTEDVENIVTAEDFELNPNRMKDLKKNVVAFRQDGKVYQAEIGSKINGQEVYNHADLGIANNLDLNKAEPGFIGKDGGFVEQYKRAETQDAVELVKIKEFKTDEGKFSSYDITNEAPRKRANIGTVHEAKEGWVVRNIWVPKELQRKGIAAKFYKQMNDESIKSTGNPLRSTQERTLANGEVVHEVSADAIALWDSLVKEGVAEKLGEKNYRFNPPPLEGESRKKKREDYEFEDGKKEPNLSERDLERVAMFGELDIKQVMDGRGLQINDRFRGIKLKDGRWSMKDPKTGGTTEFDHVGRMLVKVADIVSREKGNDNTSETFTLKQSKSKKKGRKKEGPIAEQPKIFTVQSEADAANDVEQEKKGESEDFSFEKKEIQKGEQTDLLEEGDDKSKGSTPSGNAMAAASTEDSYMPEGVEKPSQKAPTEPSPETLRQVALSKLKSNEYVDGALELLMPQARGDAGKKMSLIKRKRTAETAQLDEMTRAKLHKTGKLFHFMPEAEIVDFIDRMEDPDGARPQETKELDEAAAILREMLDQGRTRVQEFGVLEEYIENYFPHLFKARRKKVKDPRTGKITTIDVNKDTISGLLSKRSLVPKGFLKQRKYLTLKEGIDAGLELANYNPVEMTILRLHEMHRYIAGKKIISDLKEQGLAIFVPADLKKNFKKTGWTFVDDPSLIFNTKPEMNVPEAYDKLLVDQLTGVLKQMGVEHQRLPKLKGNAWGMSYSGKKIKTQFAGPVSVLAHELGHQIGDLYGLYDHMTLGPHTIGRTHEKGKLKGQPIKFEQTAKRVAIKKEFQALADLRREGLENVPEGYKKYLRKKPEKEAVLLEAWLAAPEKMAKVAPNITAEWKNFLANNDDLTPLLNLDRSVVLGTRGEKLEIKGVLNVGQWALPDEAATILKRHLAPGLGSHKNIIIRNIYDGLRRLRNISLGLSHAWSAFHGINVGTDTLNTHFGVGFQKLTRGDIKGAGLTWLKTPLAPFTDILYTGKNLIEAMGQNIDDITDPYMKKMVQAIIMAGGSASMDAAYKNNAAQGLIDSLRQVRFGETVGSQTVGVIKTPFNAAMAITEKVSSIIMEHEVPRLKLAGFALMAEDIYEQAEKHGWDDTRIQAEMAGAWDNVDNRMGQLRYDNLNWNRTFKEVVMLAFRAPGWTLGSIREFGGGVWDTATFFNRLGPGQDIVTRRMGYALGAGISYALQGMLVQYILTGEPPEEPKDLYFPKTGHLNSDGSPERWSFPHYSKDIIAWTTQPVKTLTHKLNPLWGAAIDLWTNEDYFGRVIREGSPLDQTKQIVGHFVESMFMPFSVRNYIKLHENGETVTQAALVGGSGIAPAPAYITRSPAQKMMIGFNRDRGGRSNISHADAEKSDRRRMITKDLRSGKKISADRWNGFTARQQENIKDRAAESPFRVSYRRLSFDQAVNVFSISSADERRQVFDLMVKRRRNKINPDPTSLAMYYELKLTQAQADDQVKGDVQIIRNAAWQLSPEGVSPARKAELLNAIRTNPQYEDDFKFVAAAFRHRWLFTLDGRRSGRKVGTKSYWKRLRQLKRNFSE